MQFNVLPSGRAAVLRLTQDELVMQFNVLPSGRAAVLRLTQDARVMQFIGGNLADMSAASVRHAEVEA
jgi:hypothetical protein